MRRDQTKRAVPRLASAAIGMALALCAAPNANARPDLQVVLEAPAEAKPGADLTGKVRVTVANRGTSTAAGTASRGRDGYMVDLFLTRGAMPTGFARFSEQYFDGVLLRGGRASNTRDLASGARARIRIGAEIPADAPPGQYRLCANVDPGGKVTERDERNNIACVPLRLTGFQVLRVNPTLLQLKPLLWRKLERPTELGLDQSRHLPPVVEPPQPLGGADATRAVRDDGTIEIRMGDGTTRRLRPDGLVETVLPNGQVIIPYASQAQGPGLPTLPTGLSSWGDGLAESLLLILRNILSEAELAAYMQNEAGEDYYGIVSLRLRSIDFLTSFEG